MSNVRDGNRMLSFVAVLLAVFLGVGAVVYAQANGHLTLGQAGAVSGSLTLMPPDASGWYHLDNPGNQMLRFSGGGAPGQYVYMTVSHPGKVTIYGDLEVRGRLIGAQAPRPASGNAQDGKSDSASSVDVNYLRGRIDKLEEQLKQLTARVNGR